MKKRRYEIGMSILFAGIVCAYFVFTFLPVIDGLQISLTDWNGISPSRNFVGFVNYSQFISDKHFVDTVTITLKYILLLSAGMVALGYGLALCLLQMRSQSMLLTVLFFPHIIMTVISCILWEQIFNNILPGIGRMLGIEKLSHNMLSSKETAILAVVAVDLWHLAPYAFLILFTALKGIPADMVDSARLEGANSVQLFRHIQFPMTFPSFGVVLTTAITHALTSIDTILIMTSGGPARATETLYFVVYKNSFMRQRFGYGLAQGVLLAIAAILIYLLIQAWTNRVQTEGVEDG